MDRKERVAIVWGYGEVNDLGGYYTYNKDDAYCLNAYSGKSLIFNNLKLSRISME